jgi:CheY-like chemotaxis protein
MPGRRRILLAEDEALAGLAAEDVLREAGHEVALVREARRRSRWPGEAVTDLRMPRLDGAALVRRLRTERPSLPVVAVSGYALSGDDHEALGQGGGPVVVLRKPWSPEAMVGAVRRVRALAAAAGAER